VMSAIGLVVEDIEVCGSRRRRARFTLAEGVRLLRLMLLRGMHALRDADVIWLARAGGRIICFGHSVVACGPQLLYEPPSTRSLLPVDRRLPSPSATSWIEPD